MKRNVVLTSMSCITPIGKGVNNTWDALVNQVSGINKIIKFDASLFSCSYAGEVNENLLGYLPSQGRSMMTYQNQLLLWSIIDACDQGSFIELNSEKLESVPLYFGNGSVNFDKNTFYSLIEISRDSKGKINFKEFINNINKTPPLDIVKTMATTSNYFSSKTLKTNGLGNPIYNGEASSLSAVIQAYKSIEAGENDIVIVGSAEANLIPHSYYYLNELGVSYHNRDKVISSLISKPFDSNAQGIVYSEGAGCVVMESEDHALLRNINPIARVKGGSLHLQPGESWFDLTSEGFIKSFNNSLKLADLSPNEIDVIFPFSPSYSTWDTNELQAIHSIFSDDDYQLISAKGHMGFMGSTSGIVDLILSLKAMQMSYLFKTMNFEKVNKLVPTEINKHINQKINHKSINHSLISSAGIGGFYSSIITEKWN